MRAIVDTCVIFDWVKDEQALRDGVWDIIDDAENRIYVSAETVKELIVSYNNKRILHKRWKSAKDILETLEDNYGLEVLPITRDVMATYASLTLNEAMDHRDPFDHVIISHAITLHMTLISSDLKFPFYRSQGLDLIEY